MNDVLTDFIFNVINFVLCHVIYVIMFLQNNLTGIMHARNMSLSLLYSHARRQQRINNNINYYNHQ